MKDLEELKKVGQYADQCMKCGFCSFFCPVYQEERTETSVARGKNYLTKLILKGEQEFTPEMAEILGKCLLCKRCVANCPSKTQIDRVVVAARAQMVKEKGLGFIKNFVFRRAMANRKAMGRYARLMQTFQWLMPKTEGTVRHLPDFIKSLGGRNFPALAKTFLRDRVKPVYAPLGPRKMTVAFFMGCATDFVYPELGLALITFLTRRGVEVRVPQEQNCCGAAILFSGDFETARLLADQNVKALKDVDYVVTACGTCSSTLKDYKKYLAGSEDQEKRYGELESRVKDMTEFIIDVLKVKPEESDPEKRIPGEDGHMARPLPPDKIPEHQGPAQGHPEGPERSQVRGDAERRPLLRHGRLLQRLPLRHHKEDSGKEDGRHKGDGRGHRGDGMPGVHDQPARQCPAEQDAPEGAPSS